MSTPISPDGRWHYLAVTATNLGGGLYKTGNGPVIMGRPIDTYQDVVGIQQIMSSQDGGKQVVITNLVLLSAPA